MKAVIKENAVSAEVLYPRLMRGKLTGDVYVFLDAHNALRITDVGEVGSAVSVTYFFNSLSNFTPFHGTVELSS